MADTYDNAVEAAADREQQKTLLAALGAWDRALQRDDCNAWAIIGQRGSIHTWGDGKTWVLFVACRSIRHWTFTKHRLSFCTVTQDGDDEGCLRLHQLPTADKAEIIRDVLGIRKKQEISEETREREGFCFRAETAQRGDIRAKYWPRRPSGTRYPSGSNADFRRAACQMTRHVITMLGMAVALGAVDACCKADPSNKATTCDETSACMDLAPSDFEMICQMISENLER